MKEIFYVWKDRKCRERMLISGVVFLLVSAPFKALFNLIPGVTEVRPANTIPVVFGLLWGPAGAWGTAIANACADIVVSHSPAKVWVPGFVINFFFSWFPYKLWYGLAGKKRKALPPRLENVEQIARYIGICLADSLLTTTFLGLLFQYLGFEPFFESVPLLFFNNFDFAIVLGIPLILVMTNVKSIGVWVPEDVKIKTREEDQESRPVITGMSIQAKVILGFLILAVTFVLIIGAATYISLITDSSTRKELWEYIYLVVGVALNLLFLIALIFLKYTEKHITGPIEQLSRMAREFAARPHRKDERGEEFLKNFQPVRTGDEIENLSESFQQMMTDITQYVENLQTVTAEKERIRAELEVATQIQADMLPRSFPAFPDRTEFDIYASMHPAREVGGDFYDFFLVDENHLAVVIGDVSGKGVPAALFMVIARTLIKNHAQFGSAPADIFTIVNNQLCEGNEAGLFVTAWLGILNVASGEMIYVNAGHNPPLVRRKGQGFEFLKAPAGFVLAGLEDIRYGQSKLMLSGGDELFLYTDGVTEAENRAREFYGNERLKDTLDAMQGRDARELIAGVRQSVADFADGAEQFDDITMVALSYAGRRNG